MNNTPGNDTHSVYSVGSQKNLVPIKTKEAYFRRRSHVSHLVVIILVFLVVSLSVTLLVLSIMYSRMKGTDECDSENCVRIAASFKESMDTSVDPCDNFYKYTCGRWPLEHPIPDTNFVNSWFNERTDRISRKIRDQLNRNLTGEDVPWAVKQAKILYESCMDVDGMNSLGLSPLFDLLTQLELPLVPSMISQKTGNYIQMMANVKKVLGRDIFFGVDIISDPWNRTRNVILLDVPDLNSPLPSNKHLKKRLRTIRSRVRRLKDKKRNKKQIDSRVKHILLDSMDPRALSSELEKCSRKIKSRINKLRGRNRHKRQTDDQETGDGDDDGVGDTDTDDDEFGEMDINEAEVTYMWEVIEEVISNGTIDSCDLKNGSFKQSSINSVADLINYIYVFSDAMYNLATEVSNDTDITSEFEDPSFMLIDDLQNMNTMVIQATNYSIEVKAFWRPFIEALFDGVTKLDLDGKDKILIGDLDYLLQVGTLISASTEEQLESFIWWAIVDIAVPHSSENLRQSWSKYIDSIMGMEILTSRSLRCASGVNELMGMAVSWLFIDPSFEKQKSEKVHEMLENMKASFAVLVNKAEWLDRKTKTVTLEKNRKMSLAIGYPDWLFKKGELDGYYEGINLAESQYLSNMVQIVEIMCVAEFELLREINYDNVSYWLVDPTEVNAFHTYQENQITIPAGILQFPFYDLGLEALNYGAIGTILGHELTHGFDNNGRQFDLDGNWKQWWTNKTIEAYEDRTQCFIDQYNKYYVEDADIYIDGETTLGENIADNGGLREAIIAYQKWRAKHGKEKLLPGFAHLSHEQLFFLSFGHLWCETYSQMGLEWLLDDTHCPGHVRLVAALRNSPEFSRAWNCPVGSYMNPPKKCYIW